MGWGVGPYGGNRAIKRGQRINARRLRVKSCGRDEETSGGRDMEGTGVGQLQQKVIQVQGREVIAPQAPKSEKTRARKGKTKVREWARTDQPGTRVRE